MSFSTLLENPHPPLSGFPIVILSLLVVVELITFFRPGADFHKTQQFLLCALCLFAAATYFSGYWGFDRANQTFQIPEENIFRHQGYAKFFLFLLVPLVLVYSMRSAVPERSKSLERQMEWLFRALLVLSWALAAYTSTLGGELVFSAGAAVRVPISGRASATLPREKD